MAIEEFWSHIIKIPQLEVQNATFRGEDYKVVVWRKTVLYPQKKGNLTLEPLSLNVVIGLPTNQRDFFGGRIVQQTSRAITAEKRFINVKRLPEKGKPANFFGAVGQFDFDLILFLRQPIVLWSILKLVMIHQALHKFF